MFSLLPDVKEVAVTDAYTDKLVKDTDYTLSYKDNINAGTATVILTGIGKYKGEASVNFVINRAKITTSDFTVSGGRDVEYRPGAEVEDITSELSLTAAQGSYQKKNYVFTKDDYKIELVPDQIGLAAGTEVKVQVSILEGSQNYEVPENPFEPVTGYKVKAKNVTKNNSEITVDKTTIPAPVKFDPALLGITVTVDDVKLVQDTDYTLSVEGDTSKLTSETNKTSVIITYKGNYVSKSKVPFTIVEGGFNIEDVHLVAPKGADAVYSGKAIVPAQKDSGKDGVVAGNEIKDDKGNVTGYRYYTVEYKDAQGNVLEKEPVHHGTYTATIKVTEAYGGGEGDSVTYTIDKKKLSNSEYKDKVDKISINGSGGSGGIADLLGGFDLGGSGEGSEGGSGGIGDILGTLGLGGSSSNSVSYMGEDTPIPTLSGTDADQFEVVVESFKREWDGKEESSGSLDIDLKEDSDFIYDGTTRVTKTFKWTKGTLSVAQILAKFAVSDQVYTGQAVEPAEFIWSDPDFDASWLSVMHYTNNVNVTSGSAMVHVSVAIPDDAKYELSPLAKLLGGSSEGDIQFAIVPADIGSMKIKVASAVYTGNALKPEVVIRDNGGAVLVRDKDYTVSYKDNTNAGKGTVIIKGIKNYTGTEQLRFLPLLRRARRTTLH